MVSFSLSKEYKGKIWRNLKGICLEVHTEQGSRKQLRAKQMQDGATTV